MDLQNKFEENWNVTRNKERHVEHGYTQMKGLSLIKPLLLFLVLNQSDCY